MEDDLGLRLCAAVQTLLDVLPLVMDDPGQHFSHSLIGSGQIVCERAGLDPSWAPLIESDVLRLVTETAGLRTVSLLSPALQHMIDQIDARPLSVQRALVERTAEHFAGRDEKVPSARFIAALSKSPHCTPESDRAATPIEAGGFAYVSCVESRRHR